MARSLLLLLLCLWLSPTLSQLTYKNCPLEYYLSAPNTCRMCAADLPGCRLCSSTASCAACSDQYYLQGGQCVSCQSAITACVACFNTTTCYQCLSPYYLYNGTC